VTGAPQGHPERAFADIARRLGDERAVDEGGAFHASALKVEGKIFAMLVEDRLVVELPVDRCMELVAADRPQPFESDRRRMKQWVSIPPWPSMTSGPSTPTRRSPSSSLRVARWPAHRYTPPRMKGTQTTRRS
jgi:hypothetical protein